MLPPSWFIAPVQVNPEDSVRPCRVFFAAMVAWLEVHPRTLGMPHQSATLFVLVNYRLSSEQRHLLRSNMNIFPRAAADDATVSCPVWISRRTSFANRRSRLLVNGVAHSDLPGSLSLLTGRRCNILRRRYRSLRPDVKRWDANGGMVW